MISFVATQISPSSLRRAFGAFPTLCRRQRTQIRLSSFLGLTFALSCRELRSGFFATYLSPFGTQSTEVLGKEFWRNAGVFLLRHRFYLMRFEKAVLELRAFAIPFRFS